MSLDNYKQLLDEAEHDIKNYPDRGQCYLPKPKRITLTEVWIILDVIRKPNPTIVLLYIQNSHTKMQAKCGSKKTCAINLAKFCYFVIFARFEVVTSSASSIRGNDATAAGQ